MALPPEDQHRGSRFPGPGMGNRNRPLLLGAIVILALLAILYGMRQTPVTGPESGTVNDTTTTHRCHAANNNHTVDDYAADNDTASYHDPVNGVFEHLARS